MTKRFGEQCCKGTALGMATALLLLPSLVLADGLSGTYRGFLAGEVLDLLGIRKFVN